MTKPVVLLILDGWGHREAREGNAIRIANTQTWDRLVRTVPWTLLTASGGAVGLPDGQMGNSEVGHLNLGAGRVVAQDIVRISTAIDTGQFHEIPALRELCQKVRSRDSTLHLLTLLGTGGVHAHHDHLRGAIELAVQHRVPRVAIHPFLDGRDTPPTSGAEFLEQLLDDVAAANLAGLPCGIATLMGRYYAMDRDRRWDRVQRAYQALVRGSGIAVKDPRTGLHEAYAAGETDEFVMPRVIVRSGRPVAPIRSGDGVFCINFRADRMRQILQALTRSGFDAFETGERPQVDVVTMTRYDETFPFPVAFPPNKLDGLVGQCIAEAGLRQFRTAETEKYPHVTYFFNGGLETPFPGEDRRLIDSPKVATYDLQPEMSAVEVTDGLCEAIATGPYQFLLCNYANGDMVGHTGVLEAAVKAVETVDRCLRRVLDAADRTGANVIVTADHGNCETMIDAHTGGPHTAHTTNPVPLLIVGDQAPARFRAGGVLGDVGPTALAMLGLEQPPHMTGRDLRGETT